MWTGASDRLLYKIWPAQNEQGMSLRQERVWYATVQAHEGVIDDALRLTAYANAIATANVKCEC